MKLWKLILIFFGIGLIEILVEVTLNDLIPRIYLNLLLAALMIIQAALIVWMILKIIRGLISQYESPSINFLRYTSNFTQICISVSVILIIYGYLCRIVGFYFFWESRSIGWALLLIGAVGFLSDRIKFKKIEKKKTLLEKIAVGILVFILLAQVGLAIIIPFSNAYAATKTYLSTHPQIKSEVGTVEGFSLIPTGAIEQCSDANGEHGSATINLIVKGEKKYLDVTAYVVKSPDSLIWRVVQIK